jgi:hypothetical protein
MWIWLRATCCPFYDRYWTERGVQEFEKMFGRAPFATAEFETTTERQALELLREQMRTVTHHFGDGRLNPSSIAAVFALVEEQISGHLPVNVPRP